MTRSDAVFRPVAPLRSVVSPRCVPSRSDAAMVAVGFNPRHGCRPRLRRRVATPETVVPSLRDFEHPDGPFRAVDHCCPQVLGQPIFSDSSPAFASVERRPAITRATTNTMQPASALSCFDPPVAHHLEDYPSQAGRARHRAAAPHPKPRRPSIRWSEHARCSRPRS